MPSRRIIGVLLLAVLVLALGACAPKAVPAPTASPIPTPQAAPTPAPQAGEWAKVLEAAKKEGTITVYNVLGVGLGETFQAGMKQFGIKAEIVGGSSADIMARVATDQRTKVYVGDVFVSGYPSLVSLMESGYTETVNGALPSVQEKDVWRIHPNKFEPTKVIFSFGTSITPSVIINTDLVRKSEIRSWNDLLDPKWKDRMVMSEARAGPGPGTSGLGAFMVLGEDFWKKMAAQRIILFPGIDLTVTQVALGEKSLALFPAFSRTVTAIRAGAPIQIVHLQEGTSYAVNAVNVLKSAPHPNAALVFLNWMLSKEGQAAISRATDNYSVRNDVTETWLRTPELNLGTYTLLEPPNNIDPVIQTKSRDFAIKIFGAR
ncbi:MAG: extracellular solute-binding protein [Dehalococcoidia bacterium]|nr:extracellular solute-binding protein [Dehalococcoidia bacterium]